MGITTMSWQAILALIAGLTGAGGLGALMKHWLDYRLHAKQGADGMVLSHIRHLGNRLRQVERAQAVERAGYEASTTILRHRLNNLKQCFDMLLTLIKADSSRADEFVQLVEELRARQEKSEVVEQSAIEAAKIAAAAAYDASDDDEGAR